MKIKEIMTSEPRVATPQTTLAAAAALMLDGDCGILMNDIVQAAGPSKPVREGAIVATLQQICAHRHPTPHVVAA